MMLMWGEEDGEDDIISSEGGLPTGTLSSPAFFCRSDGVRLKNNGVKRVLPCKVGWKVLLPRHVSDADVEMKQAARVVCQTPVCLVIPVQ